jgi:hypothetical protein
MNGIEERLTRDIAAVTGGVEVTESDLRIAREGIANGIESRRQRDRRRTLAAAAAAAVLIPVLGVAALQSFGDEERSAPPVAPGPPSAAPSPARDDDFLTGRAPTVERIDGAWRVDNNEIVLLFAEDGTMRVDYYGRLYSDPVISGRYQIEGDLITVTAESSILPKCVGEGFAMRASLPELGAMRFVDNGSSADGCSPLQPDEQWVLEQVLPTNSPGWREIPLDMIDAWTSPARSLMYGDWVAAGADPARATSGQADGHILELARDQSYTVADASGSIVDRGRWTLTRAAPSRLTLVSSSDSPTCRQGERLVFGNVEHGDFGTGALRATVAENTCGGAWALPGWILIPHVGSR